MGVGILKPFLDLTEADLDQMLAANVKGAFLVNSAARIMAKSAPIAASY